MLPVVVRITGDGRNVGKTRAAEFLIAELTARGHRVAAVKQSHHELPPDRPGSDTDRMTQAGAEATVFVGADGILERRSGDRDDLAAALRALAGYDVVIAEGFGTDKAGLEVHVAAWPDRIELREAATGRQLGAQRPADLLEVVAGRIAARAEA